MEQEIYQIIAGEENISPRQIQATIELLDEGNTVPFISRYRKEITGGLDEAQIRKIEERTGYLRNLEQRKEEVIRLIEEQDKLTPELEKKINEARILQEVEDLYRPYRQKRQTRAAKAREKGLEPLAELIWEQEIKEGELAEFGQDYLNPEQELNTIEDVYQGARDIIAEQVSDDAEIRKMVREITFTEGILHSYLKEEGLDEEGKYEIYYDYKEAVKKIPPHRILAVNRGEKEEVLQVKVISPEEKIISNIEAKFLEEKSLFTDEIVTAIADAYKRLIAPSIEREVRNQLWDKAEKHAITVFGENLRALLLQPPLRDQVVMGIDPGFRTGSKVCIVNEIGTLLATATIYPHPPQVEKAKAERIVGDLIKKYDVDVVAIGNGTASRETELFIAGIIKKGLEVSYTIVNEAGASVYSASELARKEFPDQDVSMRGAVSIARRLQDPLAELVKIEPRSIGVGLYQHDVNSTHLEESLQKVVESVVNYVGVDLNTASVSLLQYVAGINSNVAGNIVDYREENGRFKNRDELKNVYRLGPKTFTQAAGFVRIFAGDDPLALTPIHPESYVETRELIFDLGFKVDDLRNNERLNELRESLKQVNIEEKAEKLGLGIPTLKDIIKALKQPGRDPREEIKGPVFRTDVLKIEDLKKDMILQGTVRNVVDFGAFVDIGVKEDGLIHISELSYDYVDDPGDIVKVGDVIRVRILDIDLRRKRIALSLKL